MSSMLIHDTRLAGRVPDDKADNNYEVDASVPIAQAMAWIDTYAKSQGGLDNLYVMCHGFEADWNLHDQTCTGVEAGGFGLQLCSEGLSLSNTDVTVQLKGDIRTITIFSCATADTGEGNAGTVADGMRFCGEIAMYTGATVLAATQTQFYNDAKTFWDYVCNRPGPIDFGDWEGPVYSFSPDDGSATQLNTTAATASVGD
jgi:hypothetical protein